jgi:hypothetical protein
MQSSKNLAFYVEENENKNGVIDLKYTEVSAVGIIFEFACLVGSVAVAATIGTALTFWPMLLVFIAFLYGLNIELIKTGKIQAAVIMLITGAALIAVGAAIGAFGILPTFGLSVLFGAVFGVIGIEKMGESAIFLVRNIGGWPSDTSVSPESQKSSINVFVNFLVNGFIRVPNLVLTGAGIFVAATTGPMFFWPALAFLVASSAGMGIISNLLSSKNKAFALMLLLSSVPFIGAIIFSATTSVLPTLGMTLLVSIFLGIRALSSILVSGSLYVIMLRNEENVVQQNVVGSSGGYYVPTSVEASVLRGGLQSQLATGNSSLKTDVVVDNDGKEATAFDFVD